MNKPLVIGRSSAAFALASSPSRGEECGRVQRASPILHATQLATQEGAWVVFTSCIQSNFILETELGERNPPRPRTHRMSNTRATRLLSCAMTYQAHEAVAVTRVPVQFDTVEHALDTMLQVLWHEARENYKEPIETPENTRLHPVDLLSETPGIVVQDTSILRPPLPMRPVRYDRRRRPVPADTQFVAASPLTREEASKELPIRIDRALRNQETQAKRDIEKEKQSLSKLVRRDEKKRERAKETLEERETRLGEQREKRRAKRAERQRPDNARDGGDDPSTTGDISEELAEVDAVDVATKPRAEGEMTADLGQALEDDAVHDSSAHVLPPRIRANKTKTVYYASPVPHDRHLAALEAAWPRDELVPALLRGAPCEGLRVIVGPPGTGKTTALIEDLRNHDDTPTERILVCAPTNVATANLYSRLLAMGVDSCSLVIAPSKVPAETAVLSQDPNARIVVATISSRSGHILDGHDFAKVYVDEAAQVIEAWVWGLLRPSVRSVVLAGDPNQLPALVSEDGKQQGFDRSLMARLLENGYPARNLRVQRRMHPEILVFVNHAFYDGQLASEYTESSPVCQAEPYKLLSCCGAEEPIGTSFANTAEAVVCVNAAKELRLSFRDVIIIAPYQAQCRALLAMKSGIPVHTVDSFQGREADAVVVSMVRTTKNGFWDDERRLVVALTRARHALRVVGADGEHWSKHMKRMWSDAHTRQVVVLPDF